MSITIVAEAGTNFVPGDIESALTLVETAKETGADYVKFQAWRTDSIDRPDEWKKRCKPWEIPQGWHLHLSKRAHDLGIGFSYSVFDSDTIRYGLNVYSHLDAVKVASSECYNYELLRAINVWHSGAVWLSTTDWSVHRLGLSLAYLNRQDVTLLHCVDRYPTDKFQACLERIGWLKEEFGLPVGFSSHVSYPDAVSVAVEAANKGASVIEAHLKLESTPPECPDAGNWSLFPEEFAELVKAVKDVL